MTEPDPLAEYASALDVIRDVSSQSYNLYQKLLPKDPKESRRQYWNLVERSVAVAKSTTAAILSLVDQRYHLPALALTRVRYEQTVVLSYLLHEKPEIGFKPYAQFAPIIEYQVVQGVTSDPLLAPHVPVPVDIEALRKKALDAQLSINPGFDLQNGKFQSKWTKLDLYSMALRRDQLAAASGWLLSKHLPLSNLYVALYKTGSSPIHADGSMLVAPLWGPVTGADGKTQTDASIIWALALPAYVTNYDVIECYEALRWAGVNADQEFAAQTQRLIT